MITGPGNDVYSIEKWLWLAVGGSLIALLAGCASTAFENRSYRSQEIGKEATAKIGTPMLIREEGTIEKKRRWVGLLGSPDGWETIGTNYSKNFKRTELIYQGSPGSAINVIYRVFRPGSAMAEKQESLTFDLSVSHVIIVDDFQIKVLEADADSITYIVLSD